MSKDFSNWYVIKRDNETLVPFDDKKITKAISNAIKTVDNINKSTNELTEKTATTEVLKLLNDHISHNTKGDVVFSVEEIQNCVEKTLVTLGLYEVAKEYITYREKRNQLRMMNSSLMQTYKDFVTKPISEVDEMRENANIDGQNPMGGILKFGSEASKTFVDLYLMKPQHVQYHEKGYIHVHDKDFYTFRTTTCTQIDIKSLLRRGFHTGHGFLRTPSGIVSAAALSCIAIQSNQADQHGGQSIPNLDYGLAPYVAKTYIKKVVDLLEMTVSENTLNFTKTYLKDYYKEHNDLLSEKARKEFVKQLAIYCCNDSINESTHADDVETLIAFFVPYVEKAVERTDKETYQAMEAMVHNFNTLKSRSGGQVPFSSINFGTDTTEEGRMVSRNFLKAIDAGLGKHETSIFPVAIFQVKRGFNYNKEDPNYDLFELSCTVSSRRLFPNFLFEDSSFNAPYYKEGHPETLVAVMGAAHYNEFIRVRLNYSEIISGPIGKIVDCLFERKDCIDGDIIQFDENTQYCNLKNVEIESTTKNYFTKVKKCMRWTQDNLDWREVVFNDDSKIIVTHDHPLCSNRGRKIIDELECGDKILQIEEADKMYLIAPYKTIKSINKIVPDKANLAYDFETVTDIFGLSGIVSHNCRTRVMSNVYDPERETTYGRGNLSFTTINLPMLALDAVTENPNDPVTLFFEKLEHMEDEVFDQLLDRFEYQKHGLVKSFPTLMGQHVWMGSEHLSLNDEVGSILGHGTLTVGFIGLAETLIALTGKAHDESESSQKLGLEIVKFMHDKCVKKSNEMKLNFTLIGTPAESTVGTMMRKLRKKYGIIPNVTEHEYLTNSFHCRVYKNLNIKNKIDIEAPYHKYCLAGAISYIELNGDPSKNVKAFMDVVKYAESKDMGYFSINHAVDRCPVCNYVGVIDDSCPRCGFSEETGVDLEKLKELQKYYPDIEIPKI